MNSFLNEWFYPLAISIGVVLIAFMAFLLAKLYIISDEFVVSVAMIVRIMKDEMKVVKETESEPPAPPYIPDLPVPQLKEEAESEPVLDPTPVKPAIKGVPKRNRPKPKKKVVARSPGNGAKEQTDW